jgi:hypothetical protein
MNGQRETLAEALKLRECGIIIHPCSDPTTIDPKTNQIAKNAGKAVLIKEWSKKESVTVEDINKWFSNTDAYYQNCNIGVQMGHRSGAMSIDFDNEYFINAIIAGLDLSKVAISGRTNGRGQIWFKFNPALPAQKHHKLGIEILSNGSNSIIPPSIHKSGEAYKWKNENTLTSGTLTEMPEILIQRLNEAFQTETELDIFLSKAYHCFRNILKEYPKNIPNVHGAEGRELMLAMSTNLKALGAGENHIKMFARLMYREEYDVARTLQEWTHIDGSKTWKCETIKAKFPAFADCEHCNHDNKGSLAIKVCGDCVFRPVRGAGGCRNPENEDKTTKTKRYTVYDTPACDKFKTPHVSTKASGCNSVHDDNDGPLIIDTARAIMAKYPIITLRDNLKEMYFYKDGVYIYGAEAIIREAAQTMLYEETNKKRIGEIIYYIQNATLIDRDQINKDKSIINLKNGLYCLGTHELKPHTCTFISTCQIPVNYVPAATCPEIATFLCEVLRPRDVALIL